MECNDEFVMVYLVQNTALGHLRGIIVDRASLVVQLVNNPPARQIAVFDPWVGKITWRRERLPTPVFWPGEFHGLYSPWGSQSIGHH